MLDFGIENAEAMVYDDDRSCIKAITDMLRNSYGLHRIETEDSIFSLRIDLMINRPKLLILDYMYAGGLNLNYAAETLQSFKGCGIIYSSVDKSQIQKELGPLPPNFCIISKNHPERLRRVLDKFTGR